VNRYSPSGLVIGLAERHVADAEEVVGVAERRAVFAAASSILGQIARRLNEDGTATAQGGRNWWPSTVRDVLSWTSREGR
jgi:hypothetical protein